MKILRKSCHKCKSKQRKLNDKASQNNNNYSQENLSEDIRLNIDLLKQVMGYSSDLMVREFTVATVIDIKAAVVTISGMSARNLINEHLLSALMQNNRFNDISNSHFLFEKIKQNGIPNVQVREEVVMDNIAQELIAGNTVLLLNGVDKALIVGSQGWKDRSISEPITENVVRGPRDCFTETISNNTALIRRRIKSLNLRIESIKVGQQTKTELRLVYLQGIAREEIIAEVRNRINKIEIDGILESGYIEEFIEDTPWSPFPQIEHSERPDKVAAAILEGRIAILVDTTPFVLIVPTVFLQFIQSAEDYYERFPIGSLTRAVRIGAYFISVILPALYIALTSFHQEMIPTPLALSIAASREGVPFPSIGEAVIMEATFEILREAGVRLPKQTGQAVSIVGGLVIGQAAVQAGIVSQAMVIVVALTGISSFAIPAFNAAASGRLLRFPLMFLASILGLPGILAGLSIILIHMNSLSSFGINYMSPATSGKKGQNKDVIIRSPWWSLKRRPSNIAANNKMRKDP